MNPVMLNKWIQQPSNNFCDRIVELGDSAFASLEPARPNLSPVCYSEPRSAASTAFSMAPTLVPQNNGPNGTPFLCSSTRMTDVSTLEESISIDLANHPAGFTPLEVDGAQPTSAVSRPTYKCLLWFLNCSYLSHDKEEWETHCLSHFRDEDPPRSVSCPVCDWEESLDCGQAAWSLKMRHLAEEHFKFGHNLSASRPDFHLFTHLWQKRLIDDQDLKELKGGNHNLTHPPTNFVTTDRPRSRRERAPGHFRVQHIGSGSARRL
jgi:hypothetical protein